MISFDIQNTPELDRAWDPLASFVQAQISTGVILLEGELGAGKTTFVQVLARKMGFSGSVLSPTYSLVAHYSEINVVHLDLYRIKDRREILGLGLEDYEQSLILIEWGEAFKDMFDSLKAKIGISVKADGSGRTALIEWI